MSNYVWNKVICRKDVLDQFFIDTDPFGDGTPVEQPYISFNKLFGAKSLNEYEEKYGRYISYGWGCTWSMRADNLCELLFCTRWEYPIRAIIRTLELAHDAKWFCVEENFAYISKFYWLNDVREDVFILGDDYDQWLEENMDYDDSIKDPDDGVWHYLPTAKGKWLNWPSSDNFTRYRDVSAYTVENPFLKSSKGINHDKT